MRILVVEDEEGIASFLQIGLVQEGYQVEVVDTGEDALQRVQGQTYAGVILDLMLPGIDGFEVCRRLRKAGCEAWVLMLTARDEVPDRVRGLDCGADDYLTKPFALEELLARLRALGRRGSPSSGTVLQVRNLTLNRSTHEVTRAGQPIELSPQEFRLLEYFLRHPNQVLTRERLLREVWEQDFDPGTNVVEVYVGYLRRKVDHGFDPPLLRTVRGFGYKLQP